MLNIHQIFNDAALGLQQQTNPFSSSLLLAACFSSGSLSGWRRRD